MWKEPGKAGAVHVHSSLNYLVLHAINRTARSIRTRRAAGFYLLDQGRSTGPNDRN